MSEDKSGKNRTASDRTQTESMRSARKASAANKTPKASKQASQAKTSNSGKPSRSRHPLAPSKALRPSMSDSERNQRVSVAAYFRAEKRGFSPGGELDDWFSAETEINQFLRTNGY